MQLRTWNQNPNLRRALDAALPTASVLEETSFWEVLLADVKGEPSLLCRWSASYHHGALHAEGLTALTAFLSDVVPKLKVQQGLQRLYLMMASSGADVTQPFASLQAINSFLEALVQLSEAHHITLVGVLEEPQGTYGGASLLLASVCDTIWCQEAEQLHLVGKDKR